MLCCEFEHALCALSGVEFICLPLSYLEVEHHHKPCKHRWPLAALWCSSSQLDSCTGVCKHRANAFHALLCFCRHHLSEVHWVNVSRLSTGMKFSPPTSHLTLPLRYLLLSISLNSTVPSSLDLQVHQLLLSQEHDLIAVLRKPKQRSHPRQALERIHQIPLQRVIVIPFSRVSMVCR